MARPLALLVVLAGLALACTSCGLTSAQKIDFSIGVPQSGAVVGQSPDSISFYMNDPGEKLGYGETVLDFYNYTSSYRQIIVAQTSLRPGQLPTKLVDAIQPSDDSVIVDMTDRIDFVTQQGSSSSGPEPTPGNAALHVYLKPNTRYLIFDKLGGYKHGFVVVLRTPRA
jgi:hypothetical protein